MSLNSLMPGPPPASTASRTVGMWTATTVSSASTARSTTDRTWRDVRRGPPGFSLGWTNMAFGGPLAAPGSR